MFYSLLLFCCCWAMVVVSGLAVKVGLLDPSVTGVPVASAVSGTSGLSLTGLELELEFGLEWGIVSGEGCSDPIATSGSLPAFDNA